VLAIAPGVFGVKRGIRLSLSAPARTEAGAPFVGWTASPKPTERLPGASLSFVLTGDMVATAAYEVDPEFKAQKTRTKYSDHRERSNAAYGVVTTR